MTYEELVRAVNERKPYPMRPTNSTLTDTMNSMHVMETYQKTGQIEPWYNDAPLEEIACHLWNAWCALRSERERNRRIF